MGCGLAGLILGWAAPFSAVRLRKRVVATVAAMFAGGALYLIVVLLPAPLSFAVALALAPTSLFLAMTIDRFPAPGDETDSFPTIGGTTETGAENGGGKAEADTIAAAEAAGKARDIANRFETAVFLIAYGIAEKDGLYEADPHRYPYSQAFRHGMNILAALCAECSDDAEELLPTFNESDFIRNSAASDVREWTARWRDECREAVEGCRSIEIGPLASVDGDYFAATSECYEVLRFAENDLLGGHQERRVYEFLRAGTQEQYVYGRRMLIRHPLLTWNEYVRIKTGLALGDPDPLDQGEADTIDPVWLQEFVSMAYEPVPGAAKVCPNCGWTMTMRGKQPHCSSATCAKAVTGDFDKLDSVAHDAFRLSRGVMHYISSPGKLELAIAEAAAGLGLKYEMWPLKDTCDILIHLPDGRQLAVDAKAYGRAERLAREIEDDAGIAQMCADEVAYVVPDQVERDHPGYRALCNAVLRGKTGYSCETLRNFSKRLNAAAKGGTR